MKIKKTKKRNKIAHKYCLRLVISTLLLANAQLVQAKVTLVYTSNQPNILFEKNVAHFPQLGTLLKKLRLNPANNTLFLHGGDSFSPSAISLFDKANNIISLANIMDTSLYSISKRELSYDVDVLSTRAQGAQFPIISSNTLDTRTNEPVEGIFEEYRFDLDNMHIAIASIIDPRALVTYAPNYVKIADMEKALKNIVEKQKKADVKILMTDLNRVNSLRIAKDYNFDLILSAKEGVDEIVKIAETTLVFGGGQDGDTVIIELEKQQKLTVSAQVKNLSEHRPDPKITAFVDKYRLRLGYLYNEHIATARHSFNTLRKHVRTKENALANVFVDAVRYFFKADIAIINGGSIRNSAEYPEGHRFSRGDIQSEFPYGNYAVLIDISGADIWDMMENSVSQIEQIDGRFLHVSGMKVVYDSKAIQGSKIKSIQVNDQLLQRNRLYKMAMRDFYLKGADEYYMLKNKIPTNNIYAKERIWNIISQYFSELEDIKAPKMQRLVDISSNED